MVFAYAARTDVPVLIQEIERLTGELEKAQENAKEAPDHVLTDKYNTLLHEYQVMKLELDQKRAEVEHLKQVSMNTFNDLLLHDIAKMRDYGLTYEGIRLIVNKYHNGDISYGKLVELIRAAARAMAQDIMSSGGSSINEES